MYLLDTSVYSQPLRKKPVPAVERRWRDLGDKNLATSVHCEAEVLTGLYLKNSERLWSAYHSVLEGRIPVFPFDSNCAEAYARLYAEMEKSGKRRPVMDLLIAATAVSRNLILATCNFKDVRDLPGIRIEDWSQ